MPITVWSPPAIANQTEQVAQNDPSLAVLSDGRYVIVWQDFALGPGRIVGRIFNSDGTPDGNEFQIDYMPGEPLGHPTVVSINSYFAVSYDVDEVDRLRIFSPEGQIIDTEGIGGNFNDNRPTLIRNGGEIWFAEANATGGAIDVARFDIENDWTTTFLGKFTAQNTFGFSRVPAMLDLGTGAGVVVAWREVSDIEFRIFDDAGTAITPTDQVVTQSFNQVESDESGKPDLFRLANGSFLVSWMADSGGFPGSNFDIWGRIYDPGGTALSGAFILNGQVGGFQRFHDIVALRDGGFLMAYVGSGSRITVQLFDDFGERVGLPAIVTAQSAYTSSNDFLDAGLLRDGRVVITFSSSGADDGGASRGILSVIVDPRDGNITGSGEIYGSRSDDTIIGGSNDTIWAMSGNDYVDAGFGDDTIYGENGDDTLYSGAGDDLVFGGAGDDFLHAGHGLDTLTGNTGNDKYVVYNAGVTIVEVAGEGAMDEVRAGVDYELAAGVDVELMATTNLGGTAAIDLTGNALSQTIIGNAGANRLESGIGAASTMLGRDGDDRYVVRNTNDIIVESDTGGGDDRVSASVDYDLAAGVLVETMSTTNSNGLTIIDLTGNEVDQLIVGNNARNYLNGKGGNDELRGRGGNDRFVFDTALNETTNIDVVAGFSQADNDWILIDQDIFSSVVQSRGTMLSGYFKANGSGTATDANDHILYDTTSGELFYDADANGSGARVQFAQLSGAPSLAFDDFFVLV